nr:NIPSNAP family protein [Ramlibacter agri]
MYAARPGQCDDFLAALLQALPFRERYSPCAAVWKSSERDVEIAVHLWAYENLQQRMAARSAAMQDPDWSAYRASIRPMLASLQAWLLLPLAKEVR